LSLVKLSILKSDNAEEKDEGAQVKGSLVEVVVEE